MDRDKEKIQNAVSNARGGPTLPAPAKAIESVLFALSVGGIAFMMVTLFFTGRDAPLEGELWLTLSLLSIVVPGALGVLVRWLRMGGAAAIDRVASEMLE